MSIILSEYRASLTLLVERSIKSISPLVCAIVLAILGAFLFANSALAQYELRATYAGSGHSLTSGGTFVMQATAGQPAVSVSGSGPHIGAGFWYAVRRAETRVDVEEETPALPTKLVLEAAYPNPTSSQAIIRYAIPDPGPVELAVYDIMGRRVATLVSGVQQVGYKRVAFAADGLASGTYFVRLSVEGRLRTKRLLIVR